MSCATIMYQSRSSCIAYPRASEAAFFLQHAAKKFGVPKMHEPLDPSSAEFPSNTANSPAAAGSSSGTAGTKDSLSAKANSTAADGQALDAQYISANCVLFTYYSGDISSVVDEHFTRALNQPSSYGSTSEATKGGKEVSPMSQRNFPPSFWNSNYQGTSAAAAAAAASSSNLSGLTHADLAYPSDPYHALHGLHQGDPWTHYSLSTQSTYSHRQMHDLAYTSMPGTSRFNPQYSSLLLQPSVRPPRLPPVATQCATLSKTAAEAWASPRYHESLGAADLAHLDSNYGGGHSYSNIGNMPGLDGSVQDAAKDLYWF